ncbi:recombinase family protein, partial [Escherichia coli]|nr:recombinase family protein [Escherichia coli]
MLLRYISVTPLVVWRRATEQARQRAAPSLP